MFIFSASIYEKEYNRQKHFSNEGGSTVWEKAADENQERKKIMKKSLKLLAAVLAVFCAPASCEDSFLPSDSLSSAEQLCRTFPLKSGGKPKS